MKDRNNDSKGSVAQSLSKKYARTGATAGGVIGSGFSALAIMRGLHRRPFLAITGSVVVGAALGYGLGKSGGFLGGKLYENFHKPKVQEPLNNDTEQMPIQHMTFK